MKYIELNNPDVDFADDLTKTVFADFKDQPEALEFCCTNSKQDMSIRLRNNGVERKAEIVECQPEGRVIFRLE